MLARGSLGNPWLFSQVLGRRDDPPTRPEVLEEAFWVIDRAAEHMGPERAARYLRKFYPWYVERLELDRPAARELQQALQLTDTLSQARALLAGALDEPALAA